VLIDGDDFLLVGGELFCVALRGESLAAGGGSTAGSWVTGVPLKLQVQRVSCLLFLQPRYLA